MPSVLDRFPSASELLESPQIKSLLGQVSRNTVVTGVSRFLEELRARASEATGFNLPTAAELADRVASWITLRQGELPGPVINATGNLLDPSVGGPPLASSALEALVVAGSGYFAPPRAAGDHNAILSAGHAEQLLCRLTGAEGALVVNRHAAAIMVSAAALCAGREVIVSRGQLVEESDGQRVDDALAAAGASVREVGSANLTRLEDYSTAIGQRTAALWRVQSLSHDQSGLAASVSLTELAQLGGKQGLPIVEDAGSAGLRSLDSLGAGTAPVLGDSLRAGANIVVGRGDGLLGGPTCGLILGRRNLIEKIGEHPLFAACRADSLTLAALSATLELYLDPERVEADIPLLALLATPLANLQNRAERLGPQIAATGLTTVEICTAPAYLDSGRVERYAVPGVALALTPIGRTAQQLSDAIRAAHPALIGRIDAGRLWLNLRTVAPRYDLSLVAAFERLVADKHPPTETITPPVEE
jgi:L-seryl-tRNA(Ser) seleniumtransferase